MAVDPTYPLLPFFSLLSASVLLFLLVTNVIRHSWNLGVTFLAFWLFWENLFVAVGAIIWSDNEDIKLYVYCDIVSHVNEFTYILKPACTLILTRRLYKIASLRRVIPESRRARLVDAIIEWFLGLGLPMLVMGVFYYIVQGVRFVVDEGSGCNNAENTTGVDIFLMDTPGLVLPLISLFFYCPKIVYVFYRHSRDTNEFLQTNGSVSRAGYSRILILGCLDILLTLPFGIMQLVTAIKYGSPLPWYYGWDITHSNWAPVSFSWSDFEQGGTWDFIALFIGRCSSIILALAIFALFGFTSEARATYSRGMHAILKLFGRTSAVRKRDDMGELHFGIQSLVASGQ